MTAISAAHGSADTFAQARTRVSLEVSSRSMIEIIDAIREVSDYRFLFSVNELDNYRSRNFRVVDAELPQIMEELLKGTDLKYEVENGVVMITPGTRTRQQSREQQPRNAIITGRVSDASGRPLAGVAVIVDGTSLGTSTDANGHYRLTAPVAPDMALRFSFLGMKPLTVPYTGQATIDAVMEIDTQNIDEVVVTGIFTRDKASFTGSETTLSADDIRKLTSDNVLSALAIVDPTFKISMSNLSGSNPAAVPDFQIRGQASFGDYQTDDAVVLRGDYVTRTNQPLFVLDGVIGVSPTTIIDLDPEQVESITLLKDAAATVIYGSNASNGVVVVETKKPIPGKLRVTYNGNFGIQFPDFSDYNLTNAREKLLIEERAGYFSANDLSTQLYHAALKLDVERGVNTDWLVIPVRNAFTHRHGLNLEGGDQTLRYKIYLGAAFNPGVMKGTTLDNQAAKIDLVYRTGKIMITNQVSLDHSRSDRESPYGTFDLYASINPYLTPYDDNGNIKHTLDPNTIITAQNNPTMNPLWNTLYNSRNESKGFQVREAFSVEYTPIEKLRLTFDFQMTKSFERTDVFKSAYHTSMAYVSSPSQRGMYDYTNMEDNTWRVNLSAAYNFTFNGDHILALYGRATMGENDSFRYTERRTGFPNDRLSEIFMGSTFSGEGTGGAESVNRDVGLVFSANYSYKSRYAADFSVRVDGSTQFGRNNRFAPFWAAGLRWNIHNETFLQKAGWLDELTLRASYGITGSQSFNSWQALQMYNYDISYYHGSDVVGALLVGMGNPDLKWQQTDNYNVALNFSVLDNRLNGSLQYYYRYTKNTLLDFTLPPSAGTTTIKDNLGSISNTGIEAALSVTPWRNLEKQAFWNIGVNATRNRSRIEKISNAMENLNEQAYANADGDYTRPLPQYVNGASMSNIWGMRSLGIDPQSGDEVFVMRDGTLTTVWSSREVVAIGNTEPKLSGAISTSFGYKGLSVTMAAQYSLGGEVYNRTLADKIENANLRNNVDKRVLYDRWEKVGDQARFRRIDRFQNRQTNATSRFVMRENRLNMSSINVSYRMTSNDSKLLRSLNLASATVGLYAADIFTLSTIKRERGIYYPFAHQVSMSLNIVF